VDASGPRRLAYLSREHSSADPAAARGTFSVEAVEGAVDNALRVYVDRSIIEVYVDDIHALTARVYPTRTDSIGLVAGADGGASTAQVTAWPIDVEAVRGEAR